MEGLEESSGTWDDKNIRKIAIDALCLDGTTVIQCLTSPIYQMHIYALSPKQYGPVSIGIGLNLMSVLKHMFVASD